ncbi:MAG TPA: cyclopropane-fatty-acyl-phospholipid synthase family protein [Alphaproteobacteria bacterium]|jgi:cyclopropane-fatty-acyl-phospholipid synthase|nr:cyclopropane-fatty-acyl-phospholipid synthase family protein [Alphaproteobacteria bacterium]
MLLARLLERLVHTGTLRVIDAHGGSRTFGDGQEPLCTIRLHDPSLDWRIPLNPSLATGEAYMDGRLTIEEGELRDFLELTSRHYDDVMQGGLGRLAKRVGLAMRFLQQFNPAWRSQRNVAHHYDLTGRLYELFLDPDRQYSCAYFRNEDDGLEQAQIAKKDHIASKLVLDRPGLRVLDIGCGWGGMALHLASHSGADVKGITLSTEQAKVAVDRAQAQGLERRVRFALQDYRAETGQYDRIVSVGMFEHVGVPQYTTFFNKMRDCLAPDGVALLHTIGRLDGPGVTDPWIRKYIFPGGYVPALSEVLPVIERAGLIVTDVEVLRMHYAHTLRHWHQRFIANRDEIKALTDERFCRMWEFYLIGAEMAFRHFKQAVFQIQIARRVGAVSIVRDYMVDGERAIANGATVAA